jgi:hypothetical protein
MKSFLRAICLSLLAVGLGLPTGLADAQEIPQKLPFGATVLPNGDIKFGTALVRTSEKEIAFPANFVDGVRELEVIIASPHGRLHETLLVSEQSGLQLQALLYLTGASNGARLPTAEHRQGDLFDIFIEWTDAQGKDQRQSVETWILDTRTDQPLKPLGWVFVGSPYKDGHFLADDEGNLVVNYSIAATILDSPDPQSLDDTIHVVNLEVARPPVSQSVTVVLKPRSKPQAGEL